MRTFIVAFMAGLLAFGNPALAQPYPPPPPPEDPQLDEPPPPPPPPPSYCGTNPTMCVLLGVGGVGGAIALIVLATQNDDDNPAPVSP